MKHNVFIFHGTEGYPEENWFPWMKEKLEAKGCNVIIPQFPTPPIVPAKIAEWFDVLKEYEKDMTKDTIFIGHSLGGAFVFKVLEKLNDPIKAVFLTATPIGIKPILYYERDYSFCGFNFDWENIKTKARHFEVFHSNDDPFVCFENGEKLAKTLGVKLNFIPNAGHFSIKTSGYLSFPDLLAKIETIL